MISLRHIHKYFPTNGIQALSGADFDLRKGEIHALVGENGAGKSTLMHILAGTLEMTSGQIEIDGHPVNISSPADALAVGIGMVRQHPQLVPGLSCWEDACLGSLPPLFSPLNTHTYRKRFQDLSDRWGFDLSSDQRTDRLTVSQRQKVAVLSLILRKVKYLILDEPTAVLTPLETERLFTLLNTLRAEGFGIVLISHKLEETIRISDRITVLQQGKTIGCYESSAVTAQQLTALMFGQELEHDFCLANVPRHRLASSSGQSMDQSESVPVFRADQITVRAEGYARLRSVSLTVEAGSICGIAGVRDSGLETLEQTITGFLPIEGGSLELGGHVLNGQPPVAFRKAGLAYVCTDRLGRAVAPRFSIFDSLILHAHRRFPFLLDMHRLRSWASDILAQAQITTQNMTTRFSKRQASLLYRPTESFSGGMLQRIILSREFAERPRLLVLAEPGWGLDAAGRVLLRTRLIEFVQQGGAVILLSSDIEELIQLSQKIVVLRDGAIVWEQEVDNLTETLALRTEIARAMVGAIP
ncbi:MAG: ATP-binding cassette domain-containing protein [Termitinemataceae bacterium]